MKHTFTAGEVYVEGCPFYEQTKKFERLPFIAHDKIREANPSLISLGQMTAGIAVTFQTMSLDLTLEVSLNDRPLMNHMTACAQSGFDLYRLEKDGFLFIDVSRPSLEKASYTYRFDLKNEQQSLQSYLLYFPLYQSVHHIDLKTTSHPLIPFKIFEKEQILIYGTSITQGACASRPGLAYPALLERKLKTKCINFGFSGNGLGEKVMVELMTQIIDLKMIVIDYEANAAAANKVIETLKPMIETLLQHHQQIPIVILGRIPTTMERHDVKLKDRRLNLSTYQNNLDYEHVYFIEGDQLLNQDLGDTTIDNLHLNDLGFYRLTEKLYEKITLILSKFKGENK
jgi:lysophospholipase L1-like esterase